MARFYVLKKRGQIVNTPYKRSDHSAKCLYTRAGPTPLSPCVSPLFSLPGSTKHSPNLGIMPKSRQLLRREITYSDAKTEEVNVLHQLGYPAERTRFFAHLHDQREWMKTVVAHHLGLKSPDDCSVADIESWRHGSFNVCVPVSIDSGDERSVMMRFPLPYRVGESFRPGNADEKIQCEVGAYAWFQNNCPDVPIPKLYGFALSTGETVWIIANPTVQFLSLISWS